MDVHDSPYFSDDTHSADFFTFKTTSLNFHFMLSWFRSPLILSNIGPNKTYLSTKPLLTYPYQHEETSSVFWRRTGVGGAL